MFSIVLKTLLLKHKVSQGYSPAGENAGSLTPFEMTYSKSDAVMEKSKLYHYRNPVKRGLVERPEDWKWSSYCHYLMGMEGVVEIESEWTARKREKMEILPKVKSRAPE